MSIVSTTNIHHRVCLPAPWCRATSAIGQPNDPASIAIIDTPHNAAKVASKLAAQNVKVVVRFFARKPQPGLREKIMASDGNMIDGVREPTISDTETAFRSCLSTSIEITFPRNF